MALLGAPAAAGQERRRGCVLRVAADAITFYCGGDGGGVDGGGGGVDAVADTVAAAAGPTDDDGDVLAGLYRYFYGPNATAVDHPLVRPVRSVAEVGGGGYADAVNGSLLLLHQANATAGAGAVTLFDGLVTAVNGTAFNGTAANGTDAEDAQTITNYIFVITIGIILGAMILTTICGNALVIAAILLERNLQNVANYLIVSLAVADLMVACLVMPLGAVYEISRGWILGPELCDMWTSSDVLCCTASILHLVAIAVDRYWAVTNVDYIHTRNGKRIVGMIIVVWCVALVVSLAPQFGWKDAEYLKRIDEQKCMVSQDLGYQIFATCSTFYVPLLVILFLYWKIFKIARRRIRRRRAQRNAMLEHSRSKKPADDAAAAAEPKKCGFFRKAVFLRIKKKKEVEETAVCSSIGLIDGHSSCSMPESSQDGGGGGGQSKGGGNGSGGSGSGGGGGGDDKTTAFTITLNNDHAAGAAPAHHQHGQHHQHHHHHHHHPQHQHQQQQQQNQLQPPPPAVIEDDGPTVTDQSGGAAGAGRHTVIEMNVNRTCAPSAAGTAAAPRVKTKREKKESLEAKRERKAAKTLAIITGAFVVCWLPFFIMALVMPLCGEKCFPDAYVSSFFLWLGYFNSTLNPIIYTVFSPEFRLAFTKMICGTTYRR